MQQVDPGRPRPTPPRPLAALVVAVALLVALAACGRHSDAARAPAAGEPAATVVVTADFGGTRFLSAAVPPGPTVLDALRGLTDVRTAYGGRFVAGMFDRSSDAGAQRDWFFYVDGVLADRSAAEVRVGDGTAVWWDHRHWGGQMSAHAVVGSWPRPWAARPSVVDPPLADALRAAGGTVRPETAGAPWRVRVGTDADLRAREPAWARAARDPDGAGLTAAVEDGAVTALDGDGRRRVPVPGARALIAAVPSGDVPQDGTVLVVVGLDRAAADAAAAALARDPEIVRDAYALVLDGGGRPLRAAGRPGP